MVTMRGVEGADGQALVRAFAVEDTVASWTDGPQRLCWKSLQSSLRALRLDDQRPLSVVSWTTLITTGAQPRAHYVVRCARSSPWKAARYRGVLVLNEDDRNGIESFSTFVKSWYNHDQIVVSEGDSTCKNKSKKRKNRRLNEWKRTMWYLRIFYFSQYLAQRDRVVMARLYRSLQRYQ